MELWMMLLWLELLHEAQLLAVMSQMLRDPLRVQLFQFVHQLLRIHGGMELMLDTLGRQLLTLMVIIHFQDYLLTRHLQLG